MQVILLENVGKLGELGDQVNVIVTSRWTLFSVNTVPRSGIDSAVIISI